MRSIAGVLIGIVMFFMGVFAWSYQSQSVESTVNNSTNPNAGPAYNMTDGVLQGVSTVGSEAIVWGGIAAIILLSLGFLVRSFGGR